MLNRENLEKLKNGVIRFNQSILSFPVWVTVGISGFLRGKDGVSGWRKSEKNNRFGKMY
jgi:hypothetical protein